MQFMIVRLDRQLQDEDTEPREDPSANYFSTNAGEQTGVERGPRGHCKLFHRIDDSRSAEFDINHVCRYGILAYDGIRCCVGAQ